MLLLPLSAALSLSACASKPVLQPIPGPEVVRLVPAKVDPRLLACMDVEPADPASITSGLTAPEVVGRIGVEAERYKLAWKDCKRQIEAIRKQQAE
jgi:hypothetical protein